MQVDPVDDCTFWYTQEYIKTTGSFNWNTRIANFKFTNCGSQVTINPTSLTFASQVVGTSSTSQPVTLTNSGTSALPASALVLRETSRRPTIAEHLSAPIRAAPSTLRSLRPQSAPALVR